MGCNVLQCVCCSVLQCVAVCCSAQELMDSARWLFNGLFSIHSVLQCVAVCCSASLLWRCRALLQNYKITNLAQELIEWVLHTATHRNTLQHTATHCNTLRCNTLQHKVTDLAQELIDWACWLFNVFFPIHQPAPVMQCAQYVAVCCSVLQYVAVRCSVLR